MLLHEEGAEPRNTGPWLEARPNLARHHHIRLTHPKVCLWHLVLVADLLEPGWPCAGLAKDVNQGTAMPAHACHILRL